MDEITIKLSCPYEVTNKEWLEIVDMINTHVLRGNFETVSANIESGLKKIEVPANHNHVFIGGVCRNCGEIVKTARYLFPS